MVSKECRLCLRYEQNCVSLFAKRRGTNVAEMVRFCARVEISEDDGLPGDACGKCMEEALNAYLFVNKCRRSDAELRTAQANFKDDNEEAQSEANDQLTFNFTGVETRQLEIVENEEQVVNAVDCITPPDEDVEVDFQQVVTIPDGAETCSVFNEESVQYATTELEEDLEFTDQRKEVESCDSQIQDDGSLSHTERELSSEKVVEQEDEDDDDDQEFLVEYLDDNFKDDFTNAIEEVEGMQHDTEVLEDSETVQDGLYIICCGVRCKGVFSSLDEMKAHSAEVHLPQREPECAEKPYECNRCYTRFNSQKSLSMHSRKSQYCDFCSRIFVSLTEKRLHMQKVHGHLPITAKKSTERICCGCHQQFATEQDLRNHGEEVHSIRKKAVDETKPFQCTVCYKLFRTFESLRIHQRFVYRQKNFTCTTCGQAFVTRSKLQNHELVHSDKRNFPCDKCSKSFKKEIDLKSHLLLHDEKREECTFCGLKFHRKSNLKMHMRKHQDIFFYACSECPRKFKNNSHLKEHFKVHSKQKPYGCRFCERSFSYCTDRSRHEMTHTGNYPFECTCLKKFARKTHYEKHVAHCQEISENEYRD
nr:zinc finger protein ZFMSA12A-like isoform X2 [Aedes albopictus]